MQFLAESVLRVPTYFDDAQRPKRTRVQEENED